MNKRPHTNPKPSGELAPETSHKPGFAVRKAAADILGNVVHKRRPLDGELEAHSGFRQLAANDRALARAIIGAALRHRGKSRKSSTGCSTAAFRKKTGRVVDILHVAIAQMLFLDIPDRAAVSLAVDHAAADRRARPYKGLVNGVLRRLGRERDEVTADLEADSLNTPDWLLEKLAQRLWRGNRRRDRKGPSRRGRARSDRQIRPGRLGKKTRGRGCRGGQRPPHPQGACRSARGLRGRRMVGPGTPPPPCRRVSWATSGV
ncbi:transcription antitermination factor NusB [Roseibium salinum]|nr:transcription antitermination factor NusB [Roseibium salinum]